MLLDRQRVPQGSQSFLLEISIASFLEVQESLSSWQEVQNLWTVKLKIESHISIFSLPTCILMRLETGTIFVARNLAMHVKALRIWHILGLSNLPSGNLSQRYHWGCLYRCVCNSAYHSIMNKNKTGQLATVWVRDCCFLVYSSAGIRILICICICGPWVKSMTHPRPLFLLCYGQYKCMWFLRNLMKEDHFTWTFDLFPYWIVEVMVGYGPCTFFFLTWGNTLRMVGCGFWHCGNHCMSFENYYAWTDTNFNPC